MCGVFGWIKFNQKFSEKELNLARNALSLLKHRGPNFQGECFFDNVYMGHRRLSIIDLNPRANQPFYDDDKSLIICLNGEIYNYVELRAELKKRGIIFNTSSDTEVFLKSFKFLNHAAFQKFDGMFAGSIHDMNAKKHYIFRDFLGQKPMYVHEYENGIVYASELRSLLHLNCFKWELDLDNYLKYLANSYYILDTTPLKGIKKLLPGHIIEVDLQTSSVILKKYWDSRPGDNTLNINLSEAVSNFKNLFDRSCEISMRSDVPYGIFLSGGIDSSLILNSCHKINPDISSFNVAMSEKDFNESGKALIISNFFQIKNQRSFLMGSISIRDSINDFFAFLDEPHGDPGYINSYFLAKMCKPDITVALSGDGADELFAGYMPLLAIEKEKLFNCVPSPILPVLSFLAKKLLPGNDTYMGLQSKALSFLQGFPSNGKVKFPLWLSSISPEDLMTLCPWKEKSFFSRFGEKDTIFENISELMDAMEGKSQIQKFLYFYQKVFLPEFVIFHTDRASMQNSLEVRSPFLSVPLVEFANKLPDNFKINKGELKILLRYFAKEQNFPRSIYDQKKHGFTFPVARWLKTALKNSMDKLLSRSSPGGKLINHHFLEFLKQEHLQGRRNNYRILFNLMVFNKWLENYPEISMPL